MSWGTCSAHLLSFPLAFPLSLALLEILQYWLYVWQIESLMQFFLPLSHLLLLLLFFFFWAIDWSLFRAVCCWRWWCWWWWWWLFFHSATHWGWFSFSRADSRAATAGWHWLLLQGCRTVHYIKQVYAINDAARGAQTDGQREGQRQSEREREGRGDSWLHGRTLATEAGLRAANRNTHTHRYTGTGIPSHTHTRTHSHICRRGLLVILAAFWS